jgi:hypothetical protein
MYCPNLLAGNGQYFDQSKEEDIGGLINEEICIYCPLT